MRHTAAMLAVLVTACDAVAPPVAEPPSVTDSVPALTHSLLSEQLVRMGLLDQTVRVGFTVNTAADTGFLRATLGIDSLLTQRLRNIIDEHGWPLRSMVGDSAASAAFLITQHSPSDTFQREMLPLLEAAAAAGEATPSDVALLTDRVLTRDGKPQVYGTQFRIADGVLVPYPIEDVESLDERRARAGLMPMAEYVDMLRQTYGGPVRWPPDTLLQPPA